MSLLADLERRLHRLENNRGCSLRFADVVAVNQQDGTARVVLPDGNGMVSLPLRVMIARTHRDKFGCLPDIGEQVACLFSGQGLEQGVVLGSCYSSRDLSPNRPATDVFALFADGTSLSYDRDRHCLIMDCVGDVRLKGKNVRIEAENDLSLHSGKTYRWDVGGYGQSITANGGVAFTIHSWQQGAAITPITSAVKPPEGP